jgi:aspartyl/asparaginyl beta-hydroxylase (cupin superfamily)
MTDDAIRIANAGIAALQRGDAAGAREQLDTAITMGLRNIQADMAHAHACRLLDDAAGEVAALDRALVADRHHLPALLAMAALKRRQGDDRGAEAFYRRAFAVAQRGRVPDALHPALRDGEAFVAGLQQRYEAHLRDSLAGVTLSGRISQSLDLLLGKSQLYLQQPSVFYFPGLPQRPFFERDEFAWVAEFEAGFADMRSELQAILADGRAFEPYVQSNRDRPRPYQPLLDDPAWGALYFWQGGMVVEANAARAPATMAALALAPMPVIAGRSPIAHYSLLKPGTHIQPHHGMLNTRLICHLPLIVPDGCALRAGAETREWREGELLIFDDSFEHEAWNRGSSTRIILLFEIWRPEINDDEREALTRIFAAINAYCDTVPEA